MSDRVGYDEKTLCKALVGEVEIIDVRWDEDRTGVIEIDIEPHRGRPYTLRISTNCGDPYPYIRIDDGEKGDVDVSVDQSKVRP